MQWPTLRTITLILVWSVVAALAVVALTACFFIVRNKQQPETSTIKLKFESHYDGYWDIIRPLPQFPYTAEVKIPLRISTSETKSVVAEVRAIPETSGLAVREDAVLESPSFQISPQGNVSASGEGTIAWTWTVHPQVLGSYAVEVSFSPLVLTAPQHPMQEAVLVQPPPPVTQQIEVLDALGLSARQREVLGGIAPATTILGTIFGYPIWSWIGSLVKEKNKRSAHRRRR